jgi:ribose 1,5-bisphosphokinase PhnN
MTHEEVERQYENLSSKKVSLQASIAILAERLKAKKEKLREINIRVDRLERYLFPERKLSQTRAERFRKFVQRQFPEKLYNQLWTEAMKEKTV